MSKSIILKPRLSEKTYSLSETRVYVIDVDKSVNKHTVARAVEEQFEVKVEKVNMTNIPGKTKRTTSITGKRYLNSRGKRNDIKKAYVTLAKGHSLPFFAAVEEEEKQEQESQAKIDKAIEKQASKESKPKRGLRRNKSEDKEEK
jgi:large subunit ribosomal protein L23